MKIYSSTGTWLTHPSLPDLPWENERTDVHGITSATHNGLATTLRCACGHETNGATPEDAFTDMVAHASVSRPTELAVA